MGKTQMGQLTLELEAVLFLLLGEYHIPELEKCLLMLMRSLRSVTSMIGMVKVYWTCTISWTFFYALGMNITKKVCVKYGQTEDVDKKYCKFDEVIALMQQAIKEPDHRGNY